MKQPLKNWIIAFRPWAFPASTMPVILTMSYLFYEYDAFNLDLQNWYYGFYALIGVMFVHAGSNLISDYFDYKNNIDRKETFGSSRMIVDGVFKPSTILNYGIILLGIGAVIGLVLAVFVGPHLLWIGLLGVIGAFFYYKFKFAALGDLLIFIIYGPLIGLGTAYVMSSELYWKVLLINIPIAMLVVNILHANNTRDIKHDAVANIKTQAMLLGLKGSKIQYVVLSLGAYVVLMVLNAFGIVHPLTLITLITLPIALKNNKLMMKAEINKPEIIKNLDAMSAQLVVAFGLLFSIMNVIAKAI
ncbi:1,4-dihydroxy-2-naphthoate octaprenyltransferase [Paludibacter sp.]